MISDARTQFGDGLRVTPAHLNHLQDTLAQAVVDLRTSLGLGRIAWGLRLLFEGSGVTLTPGVVFTASGVRLEVHSPLPLTLPGGDGPWAVVVAGSNTDEPTLRLDDQPTLISTQTVVVVQSPETAVLDDAMAVGNITRSDGLLSVSQNAALWLVPAAHQHSGNFYQDGAGRWRYDGPSGPMGPQGLPGPAGLDGPQGLQGLQGPAGPAGADGATGPQGPEGQQGLPGPVGPEGPQGLQGPAGPQGAPGEQGPAGPAGADGQPGEQGPPGIAGLPGAAGVPGPAGVAGPAGADAPAGPAGSTGPIGPPGPAGVAGAQGAIGPVGPVGQVGPAGPIGPPGPAGVAGPKGDAGAAGPAGAIGATGAAGPAGPIGPLGPAGAIGPAGPAGATGPAGLAGAIGPAGPTGATGPAGPAGATGLAGPGFDPKLTRLVKLSPAEGVFTAAQLNALLLDAGLLLGFSAPLDPDTVKLNGTRMVEAWATARDGSSRFVTGLADLAAVDTLRWRLDPAGATAFKIGFANGVGQLLLRVDGDRLVDVNRRPVACTLVALNFPTLVVAPGGQLHLNFVVGG